MKRAINARYEKKRNKLIPVAVTITDAIVGTPTGQKQRQEWDRTFFQQMQILCETNGLIDSSWRLIQQVEV
jgi:hypothetical protein